jgi:hypothetical protein
MATKRLGNGGNTSRDARNNLTAQAQYASKFGSSTKPCTGLIHFGAAEVDVANFRQAKNNKSTGLQSRCDLCNRLYFSVAQKPKVRALGVLIALAASGDPKWAEVIPSSLKDAFKSSVEHYFSTSCKVKNCNYPFSHGDFRESVAFLTKKLKTAEREAKTSNIFDDRSGLSHPAPQKLHDMQIWAGKNGTLYKSFSTRKTWAWWQVAFKDDTAYCSAEVNEQRKNSEFKAVLHPISDFNWGAGNMKDTDSGHSLPAFNMVKASASVLPKNSNIGSRAYGYLAEGDHLAMARFSRQCKKKKLSLGHSPAPLRWLGKNDPHNGREEPLEENVIKRDSLHELHSIAISDPEKAASYVSWQVSECVKQLGEAKVSAETFTTRLQAAVESYFDSLLSDSVKSDDAILDDLKRADPGKTETVYAYRLEKVKRFLESRPRSQSRTDGPR